MGITTFGGNIRSYGNGKRTDLIVPGSVQLVVPIHVPATSIVTTTAPTYAAPALQVSATNTARVLLAKDTIVDMIQLNQDGGNSQTFDIGLIGVGGTLEVAADNAFITNGVGNGGMVTYVAGGSVQGTSVTALAGTRLGGTGFAEDCAVTFKADVSIASGTISGFLYYHVLDTAKSGEALPELV